MQKPSKKYVAFIPQASLWVFATNYITVSEDMENIANMFLKQRKDIVLSSFLTDSQKKRIICC